MNFNPFLPQGVCMADGEPHVFFDRVYLFSSHDKEDGDTYCMLDYEFYSAPIDDLTNWTSKGVNYKSTQDKNYSPQRKYMFAPDVCQGNDGRFYLYYCLAGQKGQHGFDGPISVAVCDTPDGKYEYLGTVKNPDGSDFNEMVCFDPAVINDNGTVRIYFGTAPYKNLFVNKLNKPMMSRVYSGVYNRDKSEFKFDGSPLGAYTMTLSNDMMTVSSRPMRIKIENAGEHDFYEGSSIRKVKDYYYFIYSSQLNHELCYAKSKSPDRDFAFGGTIISNGDVGYLGRKSKDRLNTTGTNHGSIEKIGDRWFVFYHRLTHLCDYSRVACAEEIFFDENGDIAQVPMTSMGLNLKPLSAKGKYPASICCNLFKLRGSMPHSSNAKIRVPLPVITSKNGERFLSLKNDSIAVFKSFEFSGERKMKIFVRGKGEITVKIGDTVAVCNVSKSESFKKEVLFLAKQNGVFDVSIICKKGNVDISQFEFCD